MSFVKILLVLAAIGGAFYGIDCYLKIEESKNALQQLKPELAQNQEYLAYAKDMWGKYEVLKTQADQAVAKLDSLKKQKEEAEAKLKTVMEDFSRQAKSINETVEKARTNEASLSFPEIKLTDGKVLTDAKVRKVEETQVSFMHSAGIGPVPVSLLPASLLEQLDLGNDSLTTAMDVLAAGIMARTQHLAGLSIQCPLPLVEKPTPIDLNAVVEAKTFVAKAPDEMEINVSKIRYAKGTSLNLDGAVAGSMKSVSAVPGITNPQQQTRDIKIAGFPAKRSSFSAARAGSELYSEGLYVLRGEELWVVQVFFSSKSKGGRAIAENILSSVTFDPAP